MQAVPTRIPDVIQLTPRRFSDSRGYFMETFKLEAIQDAVGKQLEFVQVNQSLSIKRDTIRGLHFQGPPKSQGKLVRCVQGRILDVAVDIRRGSPSFGQSVNLELSAENDFQLWIPGGFLHGFRTLEDNTIVSYQCTESYAPDYEGAILWNDPDIDVNWGITHPSSISERDLAARKFADFKSPFQYEPSQ